MKPGIYFDLPFEEYLKLPYLSKSLVSAVLKSPAHARAEMEKGKDSRSMRLGSYLDDLLLSGDTDKYVAEPEFYITDKGEKKPFTLRSPACRKIKERMEAEGKVVLKREDFEKAEMMKRALSESPTAKELLSGKKQVTLIWDDPETGCRLKGRIDVLNNDNITDLKTTQDASPDAFRYTMHRFSYHVQAAMYIDGWEILTGEMLPFNFVVVETEAPYGVKCYSIREDSIMLGRMRYKEAARIWRECEEAGDWPSYQDGIELIDVPAWALKPVIEGEEPPLYI